jgi:hypothetical protein
VIQLLGRSNEAKGSLLQAVERLTHSGATVDDGGDHQLTSAQPVTSRRRSDAMSLSQPNVLRTVQQCRRLPEPLRERLIKLNGTVRSQLTSIQAAVHHRKPSRGEVLAASVTVCSLLQRLT